MKQVIRIDQPSQNEKPVEFTEYLEDEGHWVQAKRKPSECDRVVYLGMNVRRRNHLFAAYSNHSDKVMIYKGHLNSGKY